MADDDDDVSHVTALLQSPQSDRIDDEGIGTEVIEDESLLNREQGATVVDGVESEGFEISGSIGVFGSDEVKIGDEVVKDRDFKLESVAVSECCIENDVVEEKGELEKNGESSKMLEGEDAVEKKGEEFENSMDACGDVERINESSKELEGDGGEENLANSDLFGMVIEDCHTKEVVQEKGEEFGKNLAVEQCAVITACHDMEQIDHSREKRRDEDGEERAAEDCHLIGKGVEHSHMSAVVEEQVGQEMNLAEEVSVTVTAIGDTAQIGECTNILKKEKVEEDNVAGNTGLISMATEDSHMNDAIVEEKSMDSEMNISLEQCAVVTTIGNMDQIADYMNKSDEDGVREENVAEDSEKFGVEVAKDHVEESGNVDNEARDGDEEMGSGEENRNNKEKLEEDISAASDVEFSLHKVVLESTGGDGDEDMGPVQEKTDNKGKLEEDLSAVPDVEFSLHKVVLEQITEDEDEDEEMGSEEENTDNKEKLEESLSAAPDAEFSLHNVLLEPTTGYGDEEMGLEVENKENKEMLQEDFSTASDVEYSLHNVVPKTAADVGDEEMGLEVEHKEKTEKLEEDLSAAPDVEYSLHNVVPETAADLGNEKMGLEVEHKEKTEKLEELSAAPDVEFSLHNVVPETAAGDGDEEMGSEEENSEDKDTLEKDLSAAPYVEFSLHNVELEPTAGEKDEKLVVGEEPSKADAIEAKIETPDSEKGNIKPKRVRKPSKVALTKKTEEDVCFICFDGGDLVVCDRR